MTRFQNRLTLPLPRILTHARFLASVLLVSLFVLNAYAQDTTSTVVRTNANGDITASGTDIGEVIKTDGAAKGDVITLYGDATNMECVSLSSAYNTVTIRSSEPGVKRTIDIPYVDSDVDWNPEPNYTQHLYNLNESGTYTFNLSDLDYQGPKSYDSFWGPVAGPFMYRAGNANIAERTPYTFNINTDNVSFKNFGHSLAIEGGVFWTSFYSSLNITARNELVFDSNTPCPKVGEAAYDGCIGGAIFSGGNLNINADSLRFINNFCNNDSAICTGGAIYACDTAKISGFSRESMILFSGNYTRDDAGAIYCKIIQFSTGKYTFEKNSASANGGAIYGSSITFSGDDTTAEFTGNWALGKGNDIYMSDGTLSFTNCGTYSFDGGIYLENGDSYSAQMTINQAQVTIEGRQYRPDNPSVEDTTNKYQLSQTTISNGGTLTANMDYINSFSGTITFDGTDSLFTLKKGSNSATIKSSEGNGVTGLNFNTASDVEAVSISSGRIDIKGTMSASLELQNDAVFSPGNSVGTLNLDGDVIANAVTLFEFAAYSEDPTSQLYDKLIINGDHSFIVGADSVIQLFFENGDSLAWAKEGAEYKLVDDAGFMSEVTDLSSLLGNYSDRFALEGRSDGLYLIGLGEPTVPVPEPSTWAMLVLGVMGMFYVRKVRS